MNNWVDGVSKAIDYIEANIEEELSIEAIAEKAYLSPFYFQKGFAMLCGYTVSEYIRYRRLALAGNELMNSEIRVIDLAMKYGYDSPDSFTKAFTRFHGVTPTAVRKSGAMIKSFTPLTIKFMLEGGYIMDYKIIEKETFRVAGISKEFAYELAGEVIPDFWVETMQLDEGLRPCGQYGINIDEDMSGGTFDYMIADDYDETRTALQGLTVKEIPAFTWAVFPCLGKMPDGIQEASKKIFSEWLPGHSEYQIVAGYFIEMYDDPKDYPNGALDKNYYCELWIPVKKK